MQEFLATLAREPAWTLVALLSGTFLLWRTGAMWARSLRDGARERRRRRARRGERAAVDLLRERGFSIVSTQPTQSWEFELDGEPISVDLRADALVERDGSRFVAEVKSGTQAPDVRTSATRRQLLEYRLGYDVDGVLLVDIESNQIRRVHFKL